MKYLRDEKGMTLTELLAALAISAMVLSVAMLAFWQINQLFQKSTEGYLERSEIKRVMSVFSTRLADSTAAVYVAAADELRLLHAGKKQAIVFDRTSGKLTIYDFTGEHAQFESTAISIESSPVLYSNPYMLTKFVSGVEYTSASGSPLPNAIFKNGELLSVEVTFEDGHTETVTVKLLEDQTSK